MKSHEAFANLEKSIYESLKTYSNVHRGSGHNSIVTTYLYEQAREIILEYLCLNKDKYTVIFCTHRSAAVFKARFQSGKYHSISSQDIGLALGVHALAVEKKALSAVEPFQTGGGTTRLIAKDWIMWADVPDKFEAGTPAIINVIAFAKALRMITQFGNDIFKNCVHEQSITNEILYHDELEKYSGKELLDEFRKTQIGRNLCVPTRDGEKTFINLDNSASTQTFTPIWNAFRLALRQAGQEKKKIVNEVKTICAQMLGAPLSDYDVIFTSNTTEAINIVATNLGLEHEDGIEPLVLNTILEHNSNDLPWRKVQGYSLIRFSSIDNEGFIDMKELELLLSAYNEKSQHGAKRIKLVAVSGASNVLGVFNNLKEISKIIHRYGARLLVDGAQMIAHRKVSMVTSGIDYLTLSAHKVYAPFGTGLLITKKRLLKIGADELKQIQLSGEENIGGIATMGKAFVILQRIGIDLIQEEEQKLTRQALRGLMQIPGIKIHGLKDPDSPRLSDKGGVLSFEIKKTPHDKIAKELAHRGGIGVRFGCHCAHLLIKHLIKITPTLENVQRIILSIAPKIQLPGVVRISMGISTTEDDIDRVINMLSEIAIKPKAGVNISKTIDTFAKDIAEKVYS